VAFIANLMNSDVEFVAVDMPAANRLTIHILAVVAEHERELISQRTMRLWQQRISEIIFSPALEQGRDSKG
jgi:DNA invertase Pin-like site-specific DNA recombinase